MGWHPRASIEHTDRMLELWAGKPSSLSSIDAWLFRHCINDRIGRETGYGPADRFLGREPFFLGVVALLNSFDDYAKGVAMRWPREIHMVRGHTWTECGMCVACWPGFPYMVYIVSNHCNSRIWLTACLWSSAHRWLNGIDGGLIWNGYA
jgi:hypothetical protein